MEKHDSQFLKVWPIEDDDDNLIMIVGIVAGSAVVISVILVLAFYLKMKKGKVKDKNDVIDNINEDKLIESRKTEQSI